MEELAELEAFNAEGGEAATPEASGEKVSVDVPEKTKEAQAKAAKKKKTPLEAATALVPKASDVPVPTGGVGLLLFIALLIAFAIMPAPGQSVTRLVLIWKALIGQATLSGGSSSGGSDPYGQYTNGQTTTAGAGSWNPYHITPPAVAPGSAWNPYGIYN